MDRGAWWAAVHAVTRSRKRLSDFTSTFHFHALEKEMATHSSVLAWRIPGTGKPGGLPSMGSHRVGHDLSDFAAAAAAKVVLVLVNKAIKHISKGLNYLPPTWLCLRIKLKIFLNISEYPASNELKFTMSAFNKKWLSMQKSKIIWFILKMTAYFSSEIKAK